MLLLKNLVDKAVLDVDAARVCPRQIANELFVRRGILKRVSLDDFKQFLSFFFEASGHKFPSIFLRLLGVNNFPGHQSSSFEQASAGSSMPSLIDSRMPGTERR